MRSLEAQATRWTRYLALGAGWVLLAVAVLTVADALLRKFLSRPLPGTFEASELLLAAVIFFAMPYTGLTDGHVSVDLLTGRLSARAQTVILGVNALVCAVILGFIAYQMGAARRRVRAHRPHHDHHAHPDPALHGAGGGGGRARRARLRGPGARRLRPRGHRAMSPVSVSLLGFAALLALILVRLPIAAAMAIVGVGGTAAIAGWPAALATLRPGPLRARVVLHAPHHSLVHLYGLRGLAGGAQPGPVPGRARVARPPARRARHGDGRGLRGLRRHLRLLRRHRRHHVLGGAARDAPLPLRRQPRPRAPSPPAAPSAS